MLMSVDDNEVFNNPTILSPNAKRPPKSSKKIKLKIRVHHQKGRKSVDGIISMKITINLHAL